MGLLKTWHMYFEEEYMILDEHDKQYKHMYINLTY